MAKRTFKGNSPKNARIKIDYSGVKPNVRFSYPSKQHQFEGDLGHLVFLAWFILFFVFFSLPISDPLKHEYITRDSMEIEATCIYNHINRTINSTQVIEECAVDYDAPGFFMWIIGFIILLFAPSRLISRLFKKQLDNLYPKWQAFWTRKKITKLDAEDVDWTKNRGYYVEIPVFSNVVLDYNATKDFSKYLKYFEIHEHNFKYYRKRKKLSTNPKTRKKQMKERKKRRLNEWIWYARFHFTEKPTKGFIEVIYK